MADMKVELLDHMGSDLDVVNAARVSMDKVSEWEWHSGVTEADKFGLTYTTNEKALSEKDTKLIHYLAKHNHWTPFSHCYAKFRIKAPIFVARQLFKHKVGLTENEVSRRYVDSTPEFFMPDKWRGKAPNVKQGSDVDVTVEDIPYRYDDGFIYMEPVEKMVWMHYESSEKLYECMIEGGVCAEQARLVLPQGMMTEWIWSGSLAAFARVYGLRMDPHAQHETRTVAMQIGNELRELFPVSWKALTDA